MGDNSADKSRGRETKIDSRNRKVWEIGIPIHRMATTNSFLVMSNLKHFIDFPLGNVCEFIAFFSCFVAP